MFTIVVTSVCASHIGLPVSLAMISASAALLLFSSSPKRRMTARRSSSAVRAQPLNAARAARTAASTCCASAAWPCQIRMPVAGLFLFSCSPLPDNQLPLMNCVAIYAVSFGDSATTRTTSPCLIFSVAACSALSLTLSAPGASSASSTRKPSKPVLDTR
ncbi:hypothetical protein D3C72_1809020 [compost metagenome]